MVKRGTQLALKSGELVQVESVHTFDGMPWPGWCTNSWWLNKPLLNVTLHNVGENPTWKSPLYLTNSELERNRAQ